MRNFVFCLLAVGIDIGFAAFSSGLVVSNVATRIWLGVPISIWAGIGGIIFLVTLTFGISLCAFQAKEIKQ